MCTISSFQAERLPDLAGRFGVYLPGRERGQLVANPHHRVTTFAAPRFDLEAEASLPRFPTQFGDEAISLLHNLGIGHFCPIGKYLGVT
jgi:hypothetical protein